MKVAVYARVSTDDQVLAETIENQVMAAQRYCENHGLQIVDWYKDGGISGTVPVGERPEGRRLLEDARKKRFDAVLIYRIDRLSRDTLITLLTFRMLKPVVVISIMEPIDYTTAEGEWMLTARASNAALEYAKIKERFILGKVRKQSEGKWVHGGSPPLGYRVNEGHFLEVYPEEAELVKQIFYLYIEERMSTIAIADYLTAMGVPLSGTSKGIFHGDSRQWRAARISKLLCNPYYKGQTLALDEGTGEGRPIVPPIVSEETWAAAKTLRLANRTNASRHSRRHYLLRGKIRCGKCGLNYAGDSSGRGEHYYYRCLGARNVNRSLPERCHGVTLKADDIEEMVWQDIRSFLEDPGSVIAQLEAKFKQERANRKPVEEEIQLIDRERNKKGNERQRVTTLFRKDLISEAEVERQLLDLEREIKALDDRREALLLESQRLQTIETETLNARILLEQLREKLESATWETKRELVEALVEGIKVETLNGNGKPSPKLTIRYRFMNGSADCSPRSFGQDNPREKPSSLVARMESLIPTIEMALQGKQIQPVLIEYR